MSILTRFLRVDDVPALLRLEHRRWTAEQAADEATLRRRIETYPDLCVGSFDQQTGEALASLFMKPVAPQTVVNARDWSECAQLDEKSCGDRVSSCSLFGISLTSVDSHASWGLIRFFWPYALREGWRDIYLGSPIPGLVRATKSEGVQDVERYARERRGTLPRDPQLRYYHQRGFREIVAVRPGYFPHAESLDYGVVLRGRIPLARLWPLWRNMPFGLLKRMSNLVSVVL